MNDPAETSSDLPGADIDPSLEEGTNTFTVDVPQTQSDDPRLGSLVGSPPVRSEGPAHKLDDTLHIRVDWPRIDAELKHLDVCVIGFPFDEGCIRNGGRKGAARGPALFRETYRKLGTTVNPEYNIDINELSVVDLGDIKGLTVEEGWQNLSLVVEHLIKHGVIPFVVGGSNDQSYSNACGLMAAKPGQSFGVVNIDAHLDVRPPKRGRQHSGSPFRQLLLDQRFQGKFIEFAAQGNQCSSAHADFVKEHNGSIYWLMKDLRAKGVMATWGGIMQELIKQRNVFVSFDLDSVTGADAPGVSCPGTIGLTAEEALLICKSAGQHATLFDLSEFNPVVDSYRTARLVANMFYFFLLGVAERKEGQIVMDL